MKFKRDEVISQATLRDSDLLKAYVEALERVKCTDDDVLLARQFIIDYGDFGYISDLYSKLTDASKTEDAKCVDNWMAWLINEKLVDLLQNYAPKGYYFGAHPGDGALIGFWKGEDD